MYNDPASIGTNIVRARPARRFHGLGSVGRRRRAVVYHWNGRTCRFHGLHYESRHCDTTLHGQKVDALFSGNHF